MFVELIIIHYFGVGYLICMQKLISGIPADYFSCLPHSAINIPNYMKFVIVEKNHTEICTTFVPKSTKSNPRGIFTQ
jgi:hypothetical protein